MKKVNKLWLTGLVFLSAAILTSCDNDDNAKKRYLTEISEIDNYVKDYMTKYDRIGLAASIIKDNKIEWSKGYGNSIKEVDLSATDETIYFTASISKTVIAVAALQLVEDGKLNLEEDINKYLDFNIKNPHRPSDVIRVKHLMTHTSSIIDDHYTELTVADPYSFYLDGEDPTQSLAEICKSFLATDGSFYSKSNFSTGVIGVQESYSYGNIALTLLAYVVERASGQSFSTYTQANIFDPLGMTRTKWNISAYEQSEMAFMYQADESLWGNYTSLLWPATSMRSTVKDVGILLGAIGSGGTYNGKEILKSQTVADMLTKQMNIPESKELQMGYVWGVEGVMGDYENLIGYIGDSEGSITYMWYNRSTNVGAVIFLNQDFENPEEGTNSLGDFVANLISVGEHIK